MLRPQESAYRDRRRIEGLWDFSFASPPVFDAEMAVPASYNDVLPGGRDHVGPVWYRKRVVVPRGWVGQRVVLHFESATHRATVWVDGAEVMSHEGGYTPFEAELDVTAGETIEIVVSVDNTLTFTSIPPGVVEQSAAGPRQRYWHDFSNYAGLHRPVWLYATPRECITDVTFSAAADGTLTWDITGGSRMILRNREGRVVASGGAQGTVKVGHVHPWAPGDGYLYELEAQRVEDGEVRDSCRRTVGFRTVTIDGPRFLINGRPFRFRGFGRHEDIPVLGRGHNDAWMLHDFALMDWIGANSFRTSHYPYSEDVLDHADRHGIVVIGETAAVGLNTALAQGTASRERFPTYGTETVNEATREVHAQAIRELVARDRHHPSVVMWSIANEPESETAAAEAYFLPLFALTRELDPDRPVGFANYGAATPDRCRLSRHADVLMLNRYYGWYVHTGDLAAAEQAFEAELRAWAATGKPILISEYGADTLPGLHAVEPTPWTEEYQSAYLEMNHRLFDRIPEVVGEHVWNFADFATTAGITRVGGNRKGVFTRDRQPKAAAHLLRRRWRGDQGSGKASP
ncbi:beta-glucuronidase [Actinoplanes sp. NPDC051475]|uniref:beta-glucuronidase n=1 Tax=Actinoplanes sp. NPDC051475 TaxID=3157225 RepID=UPI00344EBBD9